jgi:hypothetical protein
MDSTISNVSSMGSLVLMISYVVYKFVKHSRCRSICCGHKTEMSVDLESTPDAKKVSFAFPNYQTGTP